ncbi:thiamine-phosphate kinase [bacterium]|nr:thiamine-phosphate kinase [candidate division CSSED10-310 bacterium]
MKLSELGEFELIRRITANFPKPPEDVLEGIGDDCAVIRLPDDSVLLVTTDLLIDRKHFISALISPRQLGRKSMIVNLSDIAAMGGFAHSFFVSIAIPPGFDVEYIDEIYSGFRELAVTAGIVLLGGDTTGSETDLTISITLLGRAEKGKFLLRKGAQVGDCVQVSGPLGGSAAGLYMLRTGIPRDIAPALLSTHEEPPLRLATGQMLAGISGITAMIDISDGLLQDLGHICRAGGVGASIDISRIPLPVDLPEFCRSLDLDPTDWMLSGGEDYELCWTVHPDHEQEALRAAFDSGAHQAATIGQITAEQTITAHIKERRIQTDRIGYDHFPRSS